MPRGAACLLLYICRTKVSLSTSFFEASSAVEQPFFFFTMVDPVSDNPESPSDVNGEERAAIRNTFLEHTSTSDFLFLVANLSCTKPLC